MHATPSSPATLTSTHWGVYEIHPEPGGGLRSAPFRGDPEPSSIGLPLDALRGPVRVRRPAVRRSWLEHGHRAGGEGRGSEPWVEVSWDAALDLLAGEIERVRRDHGNEAILGGSYGWSSAGRFHHAQSQLRRFLHLAGGCTASVNTYSLGAAEVIMPRILAPAFGAERGLQTSWSDLEANCDLFVAFGGIPLKNSQVNSGGVSHHGVKDAIRRCRARGTEFVNISPIRGDVDGIAGAEWLALRPQTDVAVMLALAWVLVTEGLHDPAFLASHTTGADRALAYILGETDGQPKTPEWAASISGLDPDTITSLARRMAAGRTFISISWSLQRADHGEQPYWAVTTLAAILGQMGLPGGGLGFGFGAVSGIGQPPAGFAGPRLDQGTNPVTTRYPVARIADLLTSPGATYAYNGRTLTYPDIRLVFWAGGNPFHHHQDINRLLAAWRRPESIVILESYWTATARHADIVLPVATMVERNDIGWTATDARIIAMKQVQPPLDDSRSDHAILRDLAGRLGFQATFDEGRDELGWLQHLYGRSAASARDAGIELPDFATFWEAGQVEVPLRTAPMVGMQAFREDPAAAPLGTPSGRIELYSETVAAFGYEDCPGQATWLEPAEWLGSPLAGRFPLHLLTNQPATRLHSQVDFGPASLGSKIQDREPLTMHPADAAARGIRAGDVVRVFNDRGACLAGVRLDDRLRQGVVQLATGAWYDPLEPGVIGTLDVHGNPNVVTRDAGTSRLAQSSSAQTCLVEIEPWTGPLPPVRVLREPPPFAPAPGTTITGPDTAGRSTHA